jgi:hypothetical protein
METPCNCYECELNNYHFCNVTGENIEEYRNTEYKPDWCPLSPLPEKIDLDKYFMRGDCKSMTHMVMNIHDHGWNDCIDEILKGQNNEKTN